MGIRIGAVWTREDPEGAKVTTGEMSCPCGINIPAGTKIMVSIVRNQKHVEGDKLPHAYIEAWEGSKNGASS